MTSSPTISIIIPNYNHANLIGQQIASLVGQSLQPYEIIVIDDGSTDNSVDVIESFAKHHSIVHFYCNDRNYGVVYTINKAFKLAKGDYVSFQSADDLTLPGFIEKSMQCLLNHPQAGLCCSDPAYFNNSGPLQSRAFRLSRQPTYLSPQDMVEVIRKENFIVGGHTSIIKREALEGANGLIEELKWHCDWFAWHVIAFRYGACYIPEFLACQRDIHGSYSKGLRDAKEQQKVIEHILHTIMQDRYQDVRDQFADSGILSQFGTQALRLVFFNGSRFNRFRTFRFLWNTIKRELKRVIERIAPKIIKKTYRKWRNSSRPYILRRKCYGN